MELNAAAIMSSPVICGREDMTVSELVELLNQREISGVPVVDAQNRLVGVISITDLIAIGADQADNQEPQESDFHTSPAMDGLSATGGLLQPDDSVRDLPIVSLMSRRVVTAQEEDSIGRLADLLITHRIHRLIIVRGEQIAGIVSIRDILGALRARYLEGTS